jgi:hypothetical protein
VSVVFLWIRVEEHAFDKIRFVCNTLAHPFGQPLVRLRDIFHEQIGLKQIARRPRKSWHVIRIKGRCSSQLTACVARKIGVRNESIRRILSSLQLIGEIETNPSQMAEMIGDVGAGWLLLD